jgi:hypothetical protein
MRITIIREDGVVGVDRVFRQVDLSGLDPSIHAIQYDTANGAGEIEYDAAATVEAEVRDETAEREEAAAADTPEAIAALKAIYKKTLVRHANEMLTDFSPYQVYVDLWIAAAPPPPPPPGPPQPREQSVAERVMIAKGLATKADFDAEAAK